MNVLIILIFCSLSALSNAYKMDTYITCWEQNNVEPAGYSDPLWSDDNSAECEEYPDLCDAYQFDEPNANKGDVCDHTDPKTGNVRDFCLFQVRFGEEEDDEKTWSYKCWGGDCPAKDENGNTISGCEVTEKRITCCCNEDDYCNGQDLYLQYAQWGLEDNYPPDFDEICGYADDYGDWCPSTSTTPTPTEQDEDETTHYPTTPAPTEEGEDEDEEETTPAPTTPTPTEADEDETTPVPTEEDEDEDESTRSPTTPTPTEQADDEDGNENESTTPSPTGKKRGGGGNNGNKGNKVNAAGAGADISNLNEDEDGNDNRWHAAEEEEMNAMIEDVFNHPCYFWIQIFGEDNLSTSSVIGEWNGQSDKLINGKIYYEKDGYYLYFMSGCYSLNKWIISNSTYNGDDDNICDRCSESEVSCNEVKQNYIAECYSDVEYDADYVWYCKEWKFKEGDEIWIDDPSVTMIAHGVC
eukprot:429578_1